MYGKEKDYISIRGRKREGEKKTRKEEEEKGNKKAKREQNLGGTLKLQKHVVLQNKVKVLDICRRSASFCILPPIETFTFVLILLRFRAGLLQKLIYPS